MSIEKDLQNTISNVGVKEIARRTGIAASTISRIKSGKINPTLAVVECISKAVGMTLLLQAEQKSSAAPRLSFAKETLSLIRNELRKLGVRHAIIFGSVARRQDTENSDIDVFLDFGGIRPKTSDMLRAEGRVIEAFHPLKVDVVSQVESVKGQGLKKAIEKEGKLVF